MAPCLGKPEKPACAKFKNEVHDVLAYRAFVEQTWALPSASSVLVAFHNLVTSSIIGNPETQRFLAADRQRLYCAQDVISAVPVQYHSDLQMAMPLPQAAMGVPGLAAEHMLLNCPA